MSNVFIDSMFNLKLIKRFFDRIIISDSCWVWVGNKTDSGYGLIRYENKVYRTHRVSYELFKDDIPLGLQIDHLCRNRACVNPEHLEVVTQQENIKRGEAGINNRIKTNCPQGHKYSGKNKYGGRICIICCRNAKKKFRSKTQIL